MSKISILTPVKQEDIHFLSDLYKVLTEQLYQDFEWIIIKDGDFEVPVNFEGNSEFQLKIVTNQFDNGVAGARNTGITYSSGDYLYFLDCDDRIPEQTLFCLAENLKEEQVDIVIGNTKSVSKFPVAPSTYVTMFNRLLKDRHVKNTEAKPKHLTIMSLNILFKKSLINDHEIRFDSNLKIYSEMPFNFHAFDKATKILYDQDAIYLKKTRIDPALPPSLIQIHKEEVISQYPQAYAKAKALISQEHLKITLDNRVIKAYYYTYLRDIYQGSKQKVATVLPHWANALKQVEPAALRNGKVYASLETKALASGKFSLAKLLASTRIAVNSLKTFLGQNALQKKVTIGQKAFAKLKMKDDIILYESFLGRNYSDSPKYIYEYINKNHQGKYKHIWSFDGERKDLPELKHKVKQYSLAYFYYLARSKYIVNNMRMPTWFAKRDGQVFLQTWHGTPLKKLGMDIEEVHMPGTTTERYKKNFTDEAHRWDYLVSANAYSSEIFKRAFLFENEMLEYGYPRNDILNSPDRDVIAETIKKRLGIPLDKKVVLYAPTWRDDEFYGKGQYKFTLKLDLKRLKEELGDDYFFVLRTHYLIADQLDIEGVEDAVYNGSHYDDIAELYLISDILITDYSSVFFDYANLKRPILFYAYDLDKYKDTLRGFYLNHETEWPGPILQTNDEVIKTLKNIDQEYGPYQERLEQFHAEFCRWDDGNASKNVAEEVIVYNKSKLK
ncbi:CDP-glycerol:glycerophosphate glycerophosphotransferase [Anaerobacillus sp. CMMVII]|uniref:bifunctional glycosyltransferase/CDP-glycerol:glycerophosphate glycerophosphotransferase n=1 Tax=Anaerobacillus sp. CMMVII TaxID=2755588 RepID=UPI0021B7F453|nr:bifunctional glycosyltransferase family 2 protein/CDP-glycerol:glycerophosphate glycerophosphotransferase [Anaerobacillus sp. CMMVII]MCT8140330.1 CDP-glycerol:glycerophosphate glycerophosphotransferase [Anaerobacillus sp. CMMVII]